MHVVSHPEADEELEAAALWYEDRQSGLGDDLLDEFERTLRRVVASPERWSKILGPPRAKSNCYPGGGIVVPKGCYPMAFVLG
jgi:hypothetical protein